MGSCKSQRSSHASDKGTSSASMEDCLPQEVLEAILGKVGRETLCTARLVSRTLCAAASANFSSLTLTSPSPAVSLERFPRLGHVRVHHPVKDYTPAQLSPRLRALITHLTLLQGWGGARMMLPELPGMPKLRELDIEAHNMVDGAAVLHRLTTLEVLRIGDCTPPVATTITTTTWLTSLVIGLVRGPGRGWRSADFSWLQHATNLRKLQALQIAVSHEALPLIGNLTGLTGLTWLGANPNTLDTDETCSIAPLSCLCRLRSLEMCPRISESNLARVCSLGSGSLANLRLRVSMEASADCGRLLARQTALTRLSVGGAQLCHLPLTGDLRMGWLQSLELPELPLFNTVDAEGLAALQRATRLTELRIVKWFGQPDVRLSQTVGRLTQLRSLQLDLHSSRATPKMMDFRLALGPLTALSKLQISAPCLDNGDLRAVLGLTGLQVLDLQRCRLTNDVVPDLATLTNLRSLVLRGCGVTSLAPATNILNPLRRSRGWPPVHAYCR